MIYAAALAVGVLYACGVYLMLRGQLFKLLLGVALIGNAANLLIVVSAGLQRGAPPIVPPGAAAPEGPVADPLAQGLVLTAIVIGAGVLAFALALASRIYGESGTDRLDEPSGRK